MTDDAARPISLLPNGMVRIVVDDAEVMWRRPKIGELKRFDEAAGDIDEQVTRDSKAVQAQHFTEQERWDAAAAEFTKRLADTEDVDERDRIRQERASAHADFQIATAKRNTDLFARRDAAWFGWWRQVDEALRMSEVGLPDDPDEWPAWLLDEELIGRLLKHWRSSPFRAVDDGSG